MSAAEEAEVVYALVSSDDIADALVRCLAEDPAMFRGAFVAVHLLHTLNSCLIESGGANIPDQLLVLTQRMGSKLIALMPEEEADRLAGLIAGALLG